MAQQQAAMFRNQHGMGSDDDEDDIIEQTVQASLHDAANENDWEVTKKKERKKMEQAVTEVKETITPTNVNSDENPKEKVEITEKEEKMGTEHTNEPDAQIESTVEVEEQKDGGGEEVEEDADAEDEDDEEDEEKDAEAPGENENPDDEEVKDVEDRGADEQSDEEDSSDEDEDGEEEEDEDEEHPANASRPSEEKEEDDGEDKAEVVFVPDAKLGAVFGRRGQHLKMITDNTGVYSIKNEDQGTFVIRGRRGPCQRAKEAIEDLMEKGYTKELYPDLDFKEISLDVEESAIPEIVGPKRAFVKKIREEKNVHLRLPVNSSPSEPSRGKKEKRTVPITLAGSVNCVDDAEKVIKDIIEYSYSPFTHPGYEHEEIDVDPELIGFLIGRKGETIRSIQEEFRVKVKFPGEGSRKTYVCGRQKDIRKARDHIVKLLDSKRPKEDDVEEEA